MGQFTQTFSQTHIMQVLFMFAMVTTALAQYPPPPAKYIEKAEPPQPYAYEYGGADDYSKSNFRKTETQDANGNVGGSFTIALPDGRIQTTTYTADPIQGFVAEVTYSGEAVFPPAPVGGYPGEGENKYVASAVPRYAN